LNPVDPGRRKVATDVRGHREAEPPALARPVPAGKEERKRLRVLVVEDNLDSAESLRMLLEACGYEVTLASTGPEGLEAARALKPDVVLCDIGLPGLDGYGVARTLRDNPTTAKARLIAVTAYGQDEDRRRSHEAVFEQHLVKPVDPDALQRVLNCSAVLDRTSGVVPPAPESHSKCPTATVRRLSTS